MGISIACFFINIGRPEESSFLTEEEKEVIAREVESRATTIGLVAEWKIFFSNILNYVWASCYVLTCATTYSVAIFAPSFVTAFHPTYTVPQVQGQVVPIFVVSAVACLISAWLSDRFKHRAGFAIGGYLITMIGFIILRQNHISKPSIAILGLYFVSMGTFTCLPLLWNLTLVNLPSPFQKAIGCGFVVGIGNVGGFISSWLFRTSQAPHYHTGMTDSLIFTLVALGLVAFAWVFITISNRRLDSRTLLQDSSVGVKDGSQYIGSTGQVLRHRA
jgi:MFS family permease